MSEASQQLCTLQQMGAQQLDPVGFHYLEALSTRANAHQGKVKDLLEVKLAVALDTYKSRLETRETPHRAVPATPPFAQQALRDLVHQLAQHGAVPASSALRETGSPRPELKSVKQFRNTWSKLSVNKQVKQALSQAPKHAGPLNSHMVALRSLALMRDISPDYLNRFMTHIDTLLCLEQGDKGMPSSEKPKSTRTRAQ